MKRFASLVTAASMALTFSLNGHSAAPRPTLPHPTKAERARVFTHMVENTATVEQLSLMAALGGEKAEAIRELKALVGNEAFPAVKIRNNQLIVNGEESDIVVDPDNPGRVRYKNRTWLYDKAKTVDRNYLSLMKFMDASASAPSFSFIPSAHAATPSSTSNKVAAAVFVVGVVVASGGAALFPLTIGAILGGIGMGLAVIGTPASHIIAYDKLSSAEVRKILDSLAMAKEISLKCDANEALLVLSMPDGRKVRLQFTQSMSRKDGNHQYARIFDEKDGHVRAVADWNGGGPFYKDMLKCKTDEQAKAIAQQMAKTVAEVRKANEDHAARRDAPYVPKDDEYVPGGDVVHPPAEAEPANPAQ